MTQRPASPRTSPAWARACMVLAVAAGAVGTGVAGSLRYDQAAAQAAPPSAFVRIETVGRNVQEPGTGPGGSSGVFRVDCGTNANRKLSPDNPVAQPGVKHGAQHVHDFVGNLSISAESSDASLQASGTTCRNGDRSSYFWPVVRINRQAGRVGATAEDLRTAGPMTATCPTVADKLPAVPASATGEVRAELRRIEAQIATADRRLAAAAADPGTVRDILARLRTARADSLARVSAVLRRDGARPANLVSMAECDPSVGTHTGPAAQARHADHGSPAAGRPAGTGARPAGPSIVPTVDCPTVRDRLPGVPARALTEVDAQLDLLDRQIAEANQRIVTTRGQGGPDLIRNAVLEPLRGKRVAALDRIATAIGRAAPRPAGLDRFAACTLRNADGAQQDGAQQDGAQQDGAQQDGAQPGGTAPAASSPAATLEAPQGPNLELAGNVGAIVQPAAVRIEYRGNATSRVVAMPTFLKMITGDAKPTSRGPANARPSWTCSGFADRLAPTYVICPQGSKVMRVHDFPGCWDGTNTDSSDHRSHVAFADPRTGACPARFRAIPQLRISISYDLPQDVQRNGRYQLDAFPEENHNPLSDHDDFANVNSQRTMDRIVGCLNTGRRCS